MVVHALYDYLAMGGYAIYVWPAYGVSCTVLGGLALYCWRRYRKSVRALDLMQQRLGPRR